MFAYAVIHINRIEIWSYTKRGYDVDEEQVLGIRVVFQSACNMIMCSAII